MCRDSEERRGARRHCEERSDEAIQNVPHKAGLLRYARNDEARTVIARSDDGAVIARSDVGRAVIARSEATKQSRMHRALTWLAKPGSVSYKAAKLVPGRFRILPARRRG